MLVSMQLSEILSAIILILIALCILFFIVLLFFPFYISLDLEKNGQLMRGFYRIAWLSFTLKKGDIRQPFGIDPIKVNGNDKVDTNTTGGTEEGHDVKKKREQRQEERDLQNKEGWGIIRSLQFSIILEALPGIIKLLKDLLKSIHIQKLFCRLSFGADDPAQTAILFGYFCSIASALGLFGANISIIPCFGEERFDGEFSIELKAKLLWVMNALINALREKKIRTLLIKIIRGAWSY